MEIFYLKMVLLFVIVSRTCSTVRSISELCLAVECLTIELRLRDCQVKSLHVSRIHWQTVRCYAWPIIGLNCPDWFVLSTGCSVLFSSVQSSSIKERALNCDSVCLPQCVTLPDQTNMDQKILTWSLLERSHTTLLLVLSDRMVIRTVWDT